MLGVPVTRKSGVKPERKAPRADIGPSLEKLAMLAARRDALQERWTSEARPVYAYERDQREAINRELAEAAYWLGRYYPLLSPTRKRSRGTR